MKKRFHLILLFVIFLSYATAETLRTHQVSFPHPREAHYTPFTQAFPQVSFEVDSGTWHDNTEALIGALKGAKSPYDLFGVDDYFDLQKVVDAGLCADLSGNGVIREALSRMWPSIQSQVTRDDKIYAIPESVLLSAFGWCEDAWQAAGLSGTQPPLSYLDLLDFLEMWAERIKDTPEPKIRVNNMFDASLYNKQSYVIALMPVLLDCYILPLLYEGREPQFDNPVFREMLERTVRVAHALYAAEPPPSEGNLQLFDNGLLGFGIIGIRDGYSHAMPLRISTDQPALYKASLNVLCVGVGSTQEKLATAYLEQVVTHLQPYTATYAFRDSRPLQRDNLQEDIADQKQRVDKTVSQLSQGDLSSAKRQELEEQLKRQTQVLESMQSEGWKYLISPQWLNEYKEIAPQLYFPRPGPYVMSSAEGKDMLLIVRNFTEGRISMEQFIKELSALSQ